MTDVHDEKTRSRNMKAIHSRNTKPEIKVRKLLHRNGYRYRVTPSYIHGKPDIWMAKWNTAIFVNGCFWHKHNCYMFRLPKTRREFWSEKLDRNRRRDEKTLGVLSEQGIKVLSIWECALRGKNKIDEDTLIVLVRTFLLTEYRVAEESVLNSV